MGRTSSMLLLSLLAGAACSSPAAEAPNAGVRFGSSGLTATGRDDLARTVAAMADRLQRHDGDVAAAVRLAEALSRQTRVTGHVGLAMRAESALRRVLQRRPGNYDARRMLAAVLLSQHRFDEALVEAHQCLDQRPSDDWVLGVVGDARLERGEYEGAFEAFDRMAAIRPSAASYARLSYARELTGDLAGATRLMTMALEATSAHDPEALAWYRVQLAHLHLDSGHLDAATREFTHAEFVFPRHPLAVEGLARVALAAGRHDDALRLVGSLLDQRQPANGSDFTATPALMAFAGDVLTALGRLEDAERHYRLAEAIWTSDAPEPAALALFLADRPGRAADAARIAESAAATKRDIATEHALAWSYFKAGRVAEAQTAMTRALRTGSRDRLMRAHAALIARAGATLEAR